MHDELHRELAEYGADLFAVHDLDGNILAVNGALAEYLGYRDATDLRGHNLAEFLAPAVRHLLEPRLADIARNGRGRGLLRLRTRAGEEKFLEYHNTLRTKGVPRPVVQAVARDVTAARRQQTILRALYGISQAAFSAPDADRLFAAVHAIVGELMPARNFFIAFYDRQHDLLSYPYFVDEHDAAPPPGPLGRGLTAYVLRSGEPLLTSPERCAELVGRGEVENVGTPALDWLGVPLRTEQQVLGVLAVQSYTPGVRFGETEKQVLSYVSAHIAAAIERLNARQHLRDSEERLRLAVESAGLIIWDWDLGRDTIEATPAPSDSPPPALATTLSFADALALVLPEDRPHLQRAVAAAIANRASFREEFRLLDDRDAVVWREAVGQVHCNAEGQPVRVIGTARDITERRRTEAALQRRLDFEKLVAALSSRFIALSGHQVDEGIQGALAAIGEFIGADRSYVFLISPDGAHMTNTHEWCAPGIEPEIQNLQQVSMAEFPWFAAWMNRLEVMDVPDVAELPEAAAHERAVFTAQGIQSLISLPMVSRDVLIGCLGFDAVRTKRVWPAETLALLRFVGEMLVNALERRRMEERLQHDALHDGLTGLPNRAALLDRIAQAQARAAGRADYTFAVLDLDLDSFRSVNDSLGHFAGDELLVAVARRLAPVLRPGDTLAAVGGDEFVILLEPVADPVDAERMAQRVREALAASFTSGAQELFLGAGIGIALSSGGYESPQQILRDAQTALHRAKARGRGRHQIFDQPMHEEARGHFELERDLRGAHERGELLLLYQPIVSVADRRLRGFEALVRWQHPRRGLLLPAQFVPLAEAAGLIAPLGSWILGEACAQLRRWQEIRPELTMSVNLSPRQLASPDFEATLMALTAAAPTPAASLHLEITENSLLEDSAARVLARLKRQGVQIHLDDFGTGYSSLSYLSRLPIDVLKIDRSFLGDLRHAESLRIVRAIVTLAKDLALGVIVEGLETEAQFDFVRRLGVELAQGNLLGHPADAAGAGRLVAE